MCRCMDIFLFVWWMVDELICMTPLSPFFFFFLFLDMGYLFHLYFLTCLVGMWHTFFGYASFFICLVGMWHTFFGYASIISFCIARILDGNLEKESHVIAWSFILWVYGWMYLLSSKCRSIACEWMCTWSWSWAYEVILSKGSQQFDKAQWEDKLHMWKGFSNL